jgi:acetylornithine deacetylase
MVEHPQDIDLLQKLVQIESINPSLMSTGSGEAMVADALAKYCVSLNIAYELQQVSVGRSNFLATVPGRDRDHRIIFVAHMDTVPVDRWEDDPFSGTLSGGCVYGRGSCDTKGSLAAMMAACARLLR